MQAVASASATPLPPVDQRRRTPSSLSTASPHLPSPTSTSGAPGGPAVRLPPVTLPREDFLPVNFNPERRQSINSDPFLHAFSATPDHSYLRRPSFDDPSFHFSGGFQGPAPTGPGADGSTGGRGSVSGGRDMLAVHRPPSPRASASHAVPTSHPFDPHANYQFGTSFAPSSHHAGPSDSPSHSHSNPHTESDSSFPGPNSSYRFGGPPVSAPLEPPSYFDYSMRRHSLTNNQSPTRTGGGGGAGGGDSANPGTKRKSSGEDGEPTYNDGSYYPPQSRDNSSYSAPSMTDVPPPPHSKRKTSSMATEKMNGLELNEAHRRDSFSPTWEDRRDSDDSFRSAGSQQGYSMFHPAQNPSHPAPNHSPAPNQLPPPFMRPSNHPNYYDDSIGPRGSIARPMYEPEHQNFGRRPSIPSVSQMIQGQSPFYAGQPPHSGPHSAPHSAPPTSHPAPSSPAFNHVPPPVPSSRNGSGSSQPSVTIASVPPNQQSRGPANSYPIGPPPRWPPSAPQDPLSGRQGSASSLDPTSALKDSPYSRSPELRVSHKLAERKRRKEMAQLFDDLRESLPGDKGVKSSKWEILTKAVEFIGQLKAFNRELQMDNTNLRKHLGHPHPQPPPHHEMRSHSTGNAHPLQPPPTSVQFIEHAQSPVHHSHAASPRPHPSRTGSHASTHSNLSIDNGLPPNRE